MKEILDRLSSSIVVPVVVLDDPKDAVPTAKALLAGGIDVMEITFRTAAAPDSIKAVAKECPQMLVGAGTVITQEQCDQAVNCGAKFIVSPGFDMGVVSSCVDKGIAIVPGCITPTEIMAAMSLGLNVLKFFPAGVFGGLSAMKALSGPFSGIKFIPTGGVSASNICEFIGQPYIHAVGGSWVCAKTDISEGNFEKITVLCKEARKNALGYEMAHVGINTQDTAVAKSAANKFENLFGFDVKEGNSSFFASSNVEIVKSKYLGANGHIAVRTNCIYMAMADLEKKGYKVDLETAKYKGNKMVSVYLTEEIEGYAIHLVQK